MPWVVAVAAISGVNGARQGVASRPRTDCCEGCGAPLTRNGDCSNKGRKVGKHLDPTKQKHGPPASSTRHAGDFGNIEIAKDGTGTFQMNTDSLSFEAGRADTVTGRAIVVHAKADHAKGNAGLPIACGVITARVAGTP